MHQHVHRSVQLIAGRKRVLDTLGTLLDGIGALCAEAREAEAQARGLHDTLAHLEHHARIAYLRAQTHEPRLQER